MPSRRDRPTRLRCRRTATWPPARSRFEIASLPPCALNRYSIPNGCAQEQFSARRGHLSKPDVGTPTRRRSACEADLVGDEALRRDVVGDEHADEAAEERAPDRLVLARAAGDADAAIDVAELVERDTDDPLVDLGGDTPALRAVEPQADVAHGTELAELGKLFLGHDVAAALEQRRRLERADPHERERHVVELLERGGDELVLQKRVAHLARRSDARRQQERRPRT